MAVHLSLSIRRVVSLPLAERREEKRREEKRREGKGREGKGERPCVLFYEEYFLTKLYILS
jgi:hypothetical protein